jgi:drug/metabolite transporter (DMT)-like permease
LGRYAAGHVPPVALAFIRWTGAFLILIAFAWPFLKRDWTQIRQHLGIMLILTLAGITIYNSMAYWGLQYTQAINALLITSAHPLLVASWAFILYRERLTIWQTIGIALSLAGVMTILTRGDLSALREVRFNIGDIVFFSAQIIYSFYATLIKSRPDIHPISFLAFTIGAGALLLSPVYAAEVAAGITFTLDLKAFLILAYITVFPSLLAYLFFNRGIELIGPNRAAPFYHLIPIFGSALAIVFLGERPELFHAAGYGLVLAGIFIGTRGHQRVVES